jgi:hypothetical protein
MSEEKDFRELETVPIPGQYQLLETFSLNEATNINKVLRGILVSKFPLTNPIKVPNCVIRNATNFGYEVDNVNFTITIKKGIFIITEVMIQTFSDVTLSLNNPSNYYDSKPTGSFTDKDIYLAAYYNYENEQYDMTFGYISNIATYNADKEHYLLILKAVVNGSDGNITEIEDVDWHEDEEINESIYSLKVVDDGWLHPIPTEYVEANNDPENPLYDPTIIPSKITKIQLRRGDQFDINNYTPEEGELVWGINTKRLKIGDGVTRGGVDILEGNVDFLSQKKYYGTDFSGKKGFHDIPGQIHLLPYKFYKEGDLDYLHDFIPNIEFSSSQFTYISTFVPMNYNQLQYLDVGIRITYTLSGTGVEESGKNVKLAFILHNIKRGTQFDNFEDRIYIEKNLISSSDNIQKISTANLAISTFQMFMFYLNYKKVSIDDYVRMNYYESARYRDAVAREKLISQYLHWARETNLEGILLSICRLGDRETDTYPGNFNLIDVSVYPITKGSEYGYLTGRYNIKDSKVISFPSEVLHFSFDESNTSLDADLPYRCVNFCGFNSSTHGFISGGRLYNLETDSHQEDKKNFRIEFPFRNSLAQQVGELSQSLRYSGGCNSSSSGYTMHGCTETPGVGYSYIEKYTFSLEFSNSSRVSEDPTVSDMTYPVGFNSSQHGFAIYRNKIRKINFATDSISTYTLDSSLRQYIGLFNASFNSSQYGFVVGGYNTVDGKRNDISCAYRFQFPFDGVGGMLGGNLSNGRYYVGGFNSSQSGYVVGGKSSAQGDTNFIEKIDFPFDEGIATICANIIMESDGSTIGIDGTDFTTLFNQ